MASPGLVELATAEEQGAKRLLYRDIPILHLGAAICTVGALFAPLPWTYVLAVAVLTTQVGVFALRRKALGSHQLSDQARRRALFMNALGPGAEPRDIADISRRFSQRARKIAEGLDRSDYWDSPALVGQIGCESCFKRAPSGHLTCTRPPLVAFGCSWGRSSWYLPSSSSSG